MKIGMVTKAMFFDSKAVTSRVDRATRRVLSKLGAFVRTAARSSIRKRRAVSQPGNPPSSHTGLLRGGIYFGYELARRSVVIGPVPLHGREYRDALPLLEYGGTARRAVGGYSRRLGRRARGGVRTVRYRARPFMGPALERELPKLPAMWRDSVK